MRKIGRKIVSNWTPRIAISIGLVDLPVSQLPIIELIYGQDAVPEKEIYAFFLCDVCGELTTVGKPTCTPIAGHLTLTEIIEQSRFWSWGDEVLPPAFVGRRLLLPWNAKQSVILERIHIPTSPTIAQTLNGEEAMVFDIFEFDSVLFDMNAGKPASSFKGLTPDEFMNACWDTEHETSLSLLSAR